MYPTGTTRSGDKHDFLSFPLLGVARAALSSSFHLTLFLPHFSNSSSLINDGCKFKPLPSEPSFLTALQFASKIAATQSSSQPPSQNQSMASNQGTYGGAPPTGYTGGPPAALRPGGYVSEDHALLWHDVILDDQRRKKRDLTRSSHSSNHLRNRNTRLIQDPLLQTRDR